MSSQLANFRIALDRRKRPRKNLPVGRRQVTGTSLGKALNAVSGKRKNVSATSAVPG